MQASNQPEALVTERHSTQDRVLEAEAAGSVELVLEELEDGTRQALDVKAGDRVLFGKYGGSEITLDGEELLIIREDEILGIISRAGAVAGSGKKSK